MGLRARIITLPIVALLTASLPAVGQAQCVLCAKNAEFAGAGPGEGSRVFARAGVVLLVPVLCAAAALGVWVRRHGTR